MHLRLTLRRLKCFTIIFAVAAVLAVAQTPTQPPAGATGQNPAQAAPPRDLPPDVIRPNYILGPNDQILIRAPQAEEINEKPFRVDSEGNINLPLIGRV